MARKNPRRNISRVEKTNQDGTVYGGWVVRIQRQGETTSKFFSDAASGGKRDAIAVAKEFRDAIENQTAKYTVEDLAETPSIRNRSGVVGVRLHQQNDQRGEFEYQSWCWVAQWTDGHGRRRTRSFSIQSHGDEEAFQMACEARAKGVAQAKR